MTADQIVTIVTAIFGYGGVAVSLDRLRKEFHAYKAEQKRERDEVSDRLKALERAA